jgi:transketolase
MNPGLSNLDVFAATLLDIARNDRDVVVVTTDSRGSARLTQFGKTLPDQLVELGIAEQNVVGVAAGLASAGKKVFAVSPACFLTARALEQIKNDVAYSDLPVRLVGISAGVSYGALGSTHHSLHDLAALQAIHNLDLFVPADNFETRQAVFSVYQRARPAYLRFGKRPVPDLHPAGTAFEPGKALVLSRGADVTFLATGETVWRAVEAAGLLGGLGLSCGVVSLPCLRPFDEEAVLLAARQTRAVVTVEEHSLHGGLGSRCAVLLLEAGLAVRFKRVAIPDEATVNGSQEEIFAHYGITPRGLAGVAQALLAKEAVP